MTGIIPSQNKNYQSNLLFLFEQPNKYFVTVLLHVMDVQPKFSS